MKISYFNIVSNVVVSKWWRISTVFVSLIASNKLNQTACNSVNSRYVNDILAQISIPFLLEKKSKS